MNRHVPAGMTAIELLCSTALASLLLATTLGILTAVTRKPRTVGTTPRWLERLTEQIRWDLVHARRIELRDSEILLTGYGSVDPHSGSPLFQPCNVAYSVYQDRLQRRQTLLVGAVVPSDETVCVGVASLTLFYRDFAGRDEPIPLKSGQIPSAVTMRLTRVEGGTRFERTLLLR